MNDNKKENTIPINSKDNIEEIKNGDNYNVPTNYKELREASHNYEDYKYVYTGYIDYCKNHEIKLEEETKLKDKNKETKEIIDHDHRYAFDFNNPNQHQHDYSFDFDNSNNNKKDSSSNNYNYYYNNNNKNYTTNNNSNINNNIADFNKKAQSQFNCIMWIIIALFIFVPLIISLISEFIEVYESGSSNDYNYEYNYDYNNEYDNTYSYTDLIDYFVSAVEYNNTYYIDDYIIEYEEEYEELFEENWENYISHLYTETRGFDDYKYTINSTIEDIDMNQYIYTYTGYDSEITDFVEINIVFYNDYAKLAECYISMIQLNDEDWYLVSGY